MSHARRLLGILAVLASLALITADFADARRGGSFGSRGARTFQAPPATQTAPGMTAPVNRSMTPNNPGAQSTPAANRQGAGAAQRPGGFLGGFGGILGGLALGGLIGMMLGNGLGGMAGFLGLLLQVGLIALGAMLLLRLFRGRRQPAYAGPGGNYSREAMGSAPLGGGGGSGDVRPRGAGGAAAGAAVATQGRDEIGVGQGDLDDFERMLDEVQAAFSRQDFAKLRALTTPEIMSYLAEELAQNTERGVVNQVTDTHLLQGDVAEAWREGNSDYASVAMRYSSRDVTRTRATGEVVEGDETEPTETTEVWTFRREQGAPWKLSAIQEA